MTGIFDQSAHEMRSILRVQEQDKPPKFANMSKVSPKIDLEKNLKETTSYWTSMQSFGGQS